MRMELSGQWLCAAILAAVLAISHTMSIPAVNDLESQQMSSSDAKDINERATWLNTRDLEDEFVQLVDLSVHQLAAQGRINPDVIVNAPEVADTDTMKQKRGRFQGFCFRKTSTGRFLPYVCWKQDKKRR